MEIEKKKTTALIGPSGCGKSTLLRCFNRMNDLIGQVKITGQLLLDNEDMLCNGMDVVALRKRVGMVFQRPNPFPKSVYENVAYGPRVHGINDRKELDAIVEKSLRHAALWEEVRDRLNDSALGLSGGQQQRLCIARTLAVGPEVILMDEPCSALDPIATAKIENLIEMLKEEYTVIIVTHNMQQAARVSDYTGFMYLGKLIEFDKTTNIFEHPKEDLTENYIYRAVRVRKRMMTDKFHTELKDLKKAVSGMARFMPSRCCRIRRRHSSTRMPHLAATVLTGKDQAPGEDGCTRRELLPAHRPEPTGGKGYADDRLLPQGHSRLGADRKIRQINRKDCQRNLGKAPYCEHDEYPAHVGVRACDD